MLTEKGAPAPVAWTRVRAPQSSMDPAPASVLEGIVAASPATARYGTAVDAESAFELLQVRVQEQAAARAAAEAAEVEAAAQERAAKEAAKEAERAAKKEQAELEDAGEARARGRDGAPAVVGVVTLAVVEPARLVPPLGGHPARPRAHPHHLRHPPPLTRTAGTR